MKKTLGFATLLIALVASLSAQEGSIPRSLSRLDHVFVIMMENHGYSQIVGNPQAPFTNAYARSANTADNYFAIGHPSLTNYLEVVGGSNFGVQSDNNPDWHNGACSTNLSTGHANNEASDPADICPIFGTGMDAATPAVDTTNETSGPPGLNNIDGVRSIAAAHTVGKTIGDQLAGVGLSWKSYQESLPPCGADRVNFADGFFASGTNAGCPTVTGTLPSEQQGLIKLYAVKHNPFAYFRSVQDGVDPRNSLANTVGFAGSHGLWADLESGRVPSLAFIVPNQCTDQHGRDNGGPQCDFDPVTNGSQAGLNPALIRIGDQMIQTLVNAIHASPAWRDGRNAIVLLWDENDYSTAPNINKVLVVVDTNDRDHGRDDSPVHSQRFYTHFSLLKTLEAAFGLPCLNHACDADAHVMSDVFER